VDRKSIQESQGKNRRKTKLKGQVVVEFLNLKGEREGATSNQEELNSDETLGNKKTT